jgi:hypothetical protein
LKKALARMIDATPPVRPQRPERQPHDDGRQHERHEHQGAGHCDPGQPDPREEKRDG